MTTITPSDLDHAAAAIREARQLAGKAKFNISGQMDPQGLTWDQARDLANAAESVAYHAGWMLAELRRERESLPIPLAMRLDEITESDVDVLYLAATQRDAANGRLKRDVRACPPYEIKPTEPTP